MPPRFRLKTIDFKRLRPVRRLAGKYFSLSVAPHERRAAACVVSAKTARLATVRNRIKRRWRAAILPHLRQLPACALVFYAKKVAADASYGEVSADVASLIGAVRSTA